MFPWKVLSTQKLACCYQLSLVVQGRNREESSLFYYYFKRNPQFWGCLQHFLWIPSFHLSGAKIIYCFWTRIHEILGRQIPAQSQARGLIRDPERLRQVNDHSSKKTKICPSFYPQKKKQTAGETNIPSPPTSTVYNPVQGSRHTSAPSTTAEPRAAGAVLIHSFSKSTRHN